MQSAHMLVEPQLPSTSRSAERPKRWFVTAGKCVISSLLILWLLTGTSLHDIGVALQAAHVPTLLLAFSLHFLGCFISVVRWRLLLLAQQITIPLSFLLKSYMVAIFFNNLLPSTIGGDVIRIHDTYRMANNKGGAIAAVFLDRLLGIFVLMGFVLFSLFISEKLSFYIYNIQIFMIIIISFLAISAFIFILFYKRIILFTNKFKILLKLVLFIEESIEKLIFFKESKRIILVSLILSAILQANVIIYYFLISLGIGLSITLSEFFIIIPITIITMMLPISINGVGLRENIFVIILSIYNVSKHSSIVLAWIDYFMVLLLGIIGGIVYMTRR
jgi:uncharacterized protein (TIRG00374 family)